MSDDKYSRVFKIQNLSISHLDYTLRSGQVEALAWSKEQIEANNKKFLVLELSTGTGKSVFSQYFIKYYLENINSNAKFDLLTNSKLLQNQYLQDFSHLNNLWGKANYECSTWSTNCEIGKLLCKSNKSKPCEDCPYSEAGEKWHNGTVGLTNFHILGLYSLFNPKILDSKETDVLIVDEAHEFEPHINNFVAFSINAKTWKNILSDGMDRNYEMMIAECKTIADIADWIEKTFLVDILISEQAHRRHLSVLKDKKFENKVRVLQSLEELKGKLSRFLADYKSGTSQWVFDKQVVKSDLTCIIQPLWTSEIMNKAIWARYKHVILMSGTIINPNTFAFINGIDTNKMSYLSQDSPFPVKNRPIYYYNNGKMSYNNKIAAWDNFKPVIEKILNKYKGKKGIIHCGNYEILEWIKRDMGDNKRLIIADQNKREERLQEHINRTDDCVIISPSMIQGVNLFDDLSRFQIILKMPYPSLQSKINKDRLKANGEWYAWRTVSDLVQAYGRSIRSDTDYADTFILDGCFGDILAQSSHMLPKYFTNAIKRMK